MAIRTTTARKARRATKPRREKIGPVCVNQVPAVEVQWDEVRFNRAGEPVPFFICATSTGGRWTFDERSTWEHTWFPVAPERHAQYRQKANELMVALVGETPTRPARPAVEVGNVHDNQAVLTAAVQQIKHGFFDDAINALTVLENHIAASLDPKSDRLLPAVRDALQEAHAGLQAAARASADANRAQAGATGATASQLAKDPTHNLKGDLLDASVLLAAVAYAIGLAGHELSKVVPALEESTLAANAVAASILGLALYWKRGGADRLRQLVVRRHPSAA